MEHVDTDAISPHELAEADRRGLSEPLGTTDVAINHYTLAPGEAFTGAVHTHLDQEEIFYVIEGTATFETPEGTHEVAAGEAIRFAPGEFQQGYNDGDERVVALALGGPRESTEVRVKESCPDCDGDVMDFDPDAEGPLLRCPDCGATVRPEMD